mmetsp:Transcript_6269/g.17544  ORF Transcript_6269/g.17544 Transcript_6269/m.17544 type:complete len:301 (+) Transcript_6269:282-1184(+)
MSAPLVEAQEVLHSSLGVILLHYRLAHQDRTHADLLHKGHVVRSEDTRLPGHQQAAVEDLLASIALHDHPGVLQRDLEGGEVAVVDTQENELRVQQLAQLQHAGELRHCVHLDETLQPNLLCHLEHVLKVRVGENRRDEEDGVSTIGPGGKHLIRVDDKLLAEQRALHASLPDQLEVLKAALEVLSVGEDAEAGSATLLVALGDLDRVKVWLDDSLAGRGLLYLGNQPRPAGSFTCCTQGADIVPWWRGGLGHGHHQSCGMPVAHILQLLGLEPDYLLQDVARLVLLVLWHLELHLPAVL